jgi:hypothetical protein
MLFNQSSPHIAPCRTTNSIASAAAAELPPKGSEDTDLPANPKYVLLNKNTYDSQ